MDIATSGQPTLTVAAGVLIRDGKVLIARRKATLSNGGRWEFPGGKLKPGETPQICLRRELNEELGIEVDVLERLGAGTHIDKGRQLRLLFYRVRWRGGEFRFRDHSEVRWVDKSRINTFGLTPADRQFADTFDFSENG